MVEQRQIAERQRQLGNDAFRTRQYSEALRCYELGLEAQRHNMALHANAAMAALKLKCYVAAQEHCDKVRETCRRHASTKFTPQQSACSRNTTDAMMLSCGLSAGPASCRGAAQHTQAPSLRQGAAEARNSIPGAAHGCCAGWRNYPISQPNPPGELSCHCTTPQGLGQHSKAVADLQAAADILPGDAEVSSGHLAAMVA
jgi:hypothetical protein